MKIRNGFVSNSSSSSFVLCTNDSKEIEKQILLALDVSPESPLFQVATSISKAVLKCANLIEDKYKNEEEYQEMYGCLDQRMKNFQYWYWGDVDQYEYHQRFLSMIKLQICNQNIYLYKPDAR